MDSAADFNKKDRLPARSRFCFIGKQDPVRIACPGLIIFRCALLDRTKSVYAGSVFPSVSGLQSFTL